MLNLPHQPPILFAKKILSKSENSVQVLVEFGSIPTLAMMMEAAAQSSSAFSDKALEGYVVSCSNLALHSKAKKTIFTAHITSKMQTDTLHDVHFEIKDEDTLLSSGDILLMLKSD